jgi:DNA gyrase subunit A
MVKNRMENNENNYDDNQEQNLDEFENDNSNLNDDNSESISDDSFENDAEHRHETGQKIISQEIEKEMKASFLDYAMSVIVSRALPDVRDGLKPVHRRILFAMNELGMFHNKAFKKSARIVGEVLGKYHPHGDTAVYDTLVRMAQNFSLRYPLIDGQGNFGSVDGDSAAAMRYTEARLTKLSGEMLNDIEKETVSFMDNFDGSLKEPTVLPSKFPNLLVNGSSGIAVGMATNIPPHNLKEVNDAIIQIIDNPDITIKEILDVLPGPDFPTGAEIWGKRGIFDAYSTGRGKIKLKAKTHIEEKNGNVAIIVDEIPYMVNKAQLVETIADLVKDKKIPDIRDLRDESDRKGTRVVIELKKNANPEIVLNQLYKHSRMQVTFGVIMLALVNNKPQTMGIIPVLKHYIAHRQEIIRKRTEFDLDKAEKRAHILEGLLKAQENIEKVIKIIRFSQDENGPKAELISTFDFSDAQADAILDMRLKKLSALEKDKIVNEHKDLLDKIAELKSILASQERINSILKEELIEISEKYGNDRRTELIDKEDSDIDIEDLIDEHDVVVTITREGYIKRLPLETYKQQNRGGKGIIATDMKDDDVVTDVFVTSTHNYILFFTDKGKVYWQKVYQIPEGGRHSKGKPIINLIEIEKDEKINARIAVKEFSDNFNLVLCTRNGIVKKSSMSDYSRPRKGGIIAINLDDGDKLVNALMTDNDQCLLLATHKGLAIKFHESNARVIGRTSRGVKGITLNPGDYVIDMVLARDDMTLLTITENGFGKRTKISEYRKISRGGKGVINIQCSDRNGGVVAVRPVIDEDEMIFISKEGIIIRISAKNISTIGRNTQGVRIMKLKDEDRVVAAAKVIHTEDDKDNSNEAESDNDDSDNSSTKILHDLSTDVDDEEGDNNSTNTLDNKNKTDEVDVDLEGAKIIHDLSTDIDDDEGDSDSLFKENSENFS